MKTILRYITLIGIFAVPAVVFYVADSMLFPYITGKNFAFRIITEIIATSWVLLALRDSVYRPKRSLILLFFTGLLGVMLISDTLSPSPLHSFMSNFERMDGYVTLAHTFLYFIVTGSFFAYEKKWDYFLLYLVSLANALAISSCIESIRNGTAGAAWRISGTLGNSTYLAVYMLFSIGVAALYAVRTKARSLQSLRLVYYYILASIVLFVYVIFHTGTRGTVLGMLGGGILGGAYYGMIAEHKKVRIAVAGGLAVLALLVGGFIAFRDSSFIQENKMLERLTHISISEGGLRFKVWNMAWQGVQERPLFGWGHDSFNYVFNKYYDPSIYGAEEWYERAHNIVFDWLIWGGSIGAFFYFGIFGTLVYYLFVVPFLKSHQKDAVVMTKRERAVLIGLVSAYMIHNLFVFDNVISYIYFAIILAYIHTTYAQKPFFGEKHVVQYDTWMTVAVPLAAVLCITSMWLVNHNGIATARGLISTVSTPDVDLKLKGFQKLLERGSFADQEVREQLLSFAGSVSPKVPVAFQTTLLTYVHTQIQLQEAQKPGDARVHVLAGEFYKKAGLYGYAEKELLRALELSPHKTSIKQGLGFLYVSQDDVSHGLEYLKSAYEADTSKVRARLMYALGMLYADDIDGYDALIAGYEAAAANVDFIIPTLYQKGYLNRAASLYTIRLTGVRDVFDDYKNLAVLYYEIGDTEKAIKTLADAKELFPDQSTEIDALLDQLQKQ